MNKTHELKITLHIREPFITGTGTDSARGIDQMFARDWQGQIILPGSHVKGKLREAFDGLKPTGLLEEEETDRLLGRGADTLKESNNQEREVAPEPEPKAHQLRGKLNFSDFRPENSDTPCKTATKVKMDTQTGTAKENALVTIEHLNTPASLSVWTGTLSVVTDKEDAEEIRNTVLAWHWEKNYETHQS